ncbi:hypothetical protein FHQ26_02855 [Testudinibacter sp. TR-2022]|uniref:hypothetical protein n=1 Tax=Testudinibacter sp. TR-2022 TaxID=2585029 RepID=UPI0011187308|nr:hypothetical protein [Testudinibacter sp. TR-2022]TNH04146.1 hypothetical protein FHQ22_05490 [Pasteurellaceae bacterium Phil31]TNH11902.1 hypothetical protein FHQ26_02855 [Testudinibacter sp. TR-2022]TNH12599.1 hypothetical protein FHQ25_00125 [Testudinibacter sp. TR-2022]
MKTINSKTCAVLLLSALLAACGGGGSGSSNTTTTSSTTTINSDSNIAPKADDAALTALKEKEALQKAEQERQKRAKEEEEKQKNGPQPVEPAPQPADPVAPQPADPVAPQPADPVAPQPADPVAPQPAEPAAPQPAEPAAPQPADPVVPQPAEPAAPPAVEHQGYVISQDGVKSAWDGEASGYQVKQQGDEFTAVAQGSSLQIGDMKLDLIDSSNANLGYYGYVSTFTPDSGIVGEGNGQKRTVDLMYAVDQNKKDATAPTLNGYQGTVTYGGDFHYLADTDQVNQANISLSYNPAAKTMAGNIRDTSKGIDLGLQLSGELNGDFQMIATPVRNNHTSTVITERGSLNGQFLDGGKYIVGDAESGDANKQWKGVFSTKETERVPN